MVTIPMMMKETSTTASMEKCTRRRKVSANNLVEKRGLIRYEIYT